MNTRARTPRGLKPLALFATAATLVVVSIVGIPLSASGATVLYLYAQRTKGLWKSSVADYHVGGVVYGATQSTQVKESNGVYITSGAWGVATSYSRAWNMEKCVWTFDPVPNTSLLLDCSYKE